MYRPAVVVATLLFAAPAHADAVDDVAQQLLDSSSYKVRTQAAVVLGQLGDKRGVKALLQALKDEHETVRATAATSLGKLKDARAFAPLEALRSDPSPYVRESVARALSLVQAARAFSLPVATSAAATALGTRFYVTSRVNGKVSPAVLEALRRRLAAALAKLPRVTTSLDGAPLTERLAEHHLGGWLVEGDVTNLKVSGGQLDCAIRGALATFPAGSIKANLQGEASVLGVTGAGDAGAQRDCLEAAAQSLADQVGAFLRKQP